MLTDHIRKQVEWVVSQLKNIELSAVPSAIDGAPHWRRRTAVAAALALIVLAAFGLRLYALHEKPYPLRDEIYYLKVGEIWRDAGRKAIYTEDVVLPPLFPWLAQSLSRETNSSIETAGAIINIGAGCVMVLLMFVWGWLLGSLALGLLMAFLTALHPELIEYAASYLREMTGMALLTALLVCYTAALTRRRFWWCGPAGVCGFLASCGRAEYLEMALYIPLFEFLWCILHPEKGVWQDALLRLLSLAVGALFAAVSFSLILDADLHFWTESVFRRMFSRIQERAL